jgi:hypothetical protein
MSEIKIVIFNKKALNGIIMLIEKKWTIRAGFTSIIDIMNE